MLAASFTMLRCTISNTSLIFDTNMTQILNHSQIAAAVEICFVLIVTSWLALILTLSEITADNSGSWSDSNPIVIQCLKKTELSNWISPGSVRSYNPVRQKRALYYTYLRICCYKYARHLVLKGLRSQFPQGCSRNNTYLHSLVADMEKMKLLCLHFSLSLDSSFFGMKVRTFRLLLCYNEMSKPAIVNSFEFAS